jgi:hypothetical protein
MAIGEEFHPVNGLVPVADAFAGTVYSDVVNLSEYGKAMFFVIKGAGATGTSTVTVEACSTAAAAAVQAVAFRYKYDIDAGVTASSDTYSAMAACASTGFTTTAGAEGVYMVEISSDELYSTYKYARLKMVEVANDPVTGCVFILLSQPRYGEAVMDSALV